MFLKKYYFIRFLHRLLVLVLLFIILAVLSIKIADQLWKPEFRGISNRRHTINQIVKSLNNKTTILSRRRHWLLPPSVSQKLELPIAKGPTKDWHDFASMQKDEARFGLGEQGKRGILQDLSIKELEKSLSANNGFNALLSDHISVNRSVPDARDSRCLKKKYLAVLPTVSVVIPFYDEYLSVLLRTIHSIHNRSPPELLKEIILVDDFSDRAYLNKELADYISKHFPQLVQIVRLKKRSGLVGARLAGARRATSDVLIFFDSHVEVGYNWLPPLLEPIAMNPKIATCPIVHNIQHATFEYLNGIKYGSRGAFNWEMYYQQLPLLPEDLVDITKPSKNPIMMGGLFAIGRQFFWELGGYDEGLDIWGAEQFELSFKIWMCGGMLFDVPCSRVGHVFRGPMITRPNPRKYNFVARNQKRVAEVWMDEYKQYVYQRNTDLYKCIDAGDLTKTKAIREKLQCKSFKWFLTEVAPDILQTFPPIEPPPYASGAIQSAVYQHLCLDNLNKGRNNAVGLFSCAANKTQPQRNQFWHLSSHRDLSQFSRTFCLDVYNYNANATIWMQGCHNQGGNQFWYYDRQHRWLVHGRNGNRCMEAYVNGGKSGVWVNTCDARNLAMRWNFGNVNHTALDGFYANIDINKKL